MARPRSEEARRKAIEAATDLIVERGVAALTIEEVAARSGVAKTTDLPPLAGAPGADPRHGAGIVPARRHARHGHRCAAISWPSSAGMVHADLSGKVGRLMPCLIDAASRDPEMELLLERLGEERQAPIMEIVERAQARGELPAGLDRARGGRLDRRSDRVPQGDAAPTHRRRLRRGVPRRRHHRPRRHCAGRLTAAVSRHRRPLTAFCP